VGGYILIDVLIKLVHAPGSILLYILVVRVLLLDKLGKGETNISTVQEHQTSLNYCI
jgi:hypothetical protein